jgi:hypothetical protein
MRTTGWINHNSTTMTNSSLNNKNNSSTYENRWFFGMKIAAAHRQLKRWTEERNTGNKKVCGNIYGHYLNYRIAHILHKTKKDGTQNFFEHFNRHGYFWK